VDDRVEVRVVASHVSGLAVGGAQARVVAHSAACVRWVWGSLRAGVGKLRR